MGTFRVAVAVVNPDSDARETVAAPVDTGATFSVMPASLLRRLGIPPAQTPQLRLANGQVAERPTGVAYFEVNGRDGVARVVFGPENCACWAPRHWKTSLSSSIPSTSC